MRFVIFALILLALAGCGSESSTVGGPVTLPATPATSAQRVGTVRLARNVPGVPVEVQTLDGQTVTQGTAGADSVFRLSNVPAEGRVVARVPGGPTLSLEFRHGARRWLWLSPVTTIVSRYLRTHPGVSLEDATARVRRYLDIPARVDLGSGLGDTPNSPFSWTAFTQAAGSRSLDAFLDEQVAAVDTGAVRSFRAPDPYGAVRELIQNAATARRNRQLLEGIRAAFVESVATNIFSNYLGGAITDVGGWICEGLGLNFGESKQLTEIQNQLTAISTELNTVALQLSALTTTVNTDFADLTGQLAQSSNQQAFNAGQTTLNASAQRIALNAGQLAALASASPVQYQVPI